MPLRVSAAEAPPDPLRSPGWRYMYERFLADAPMRFDERVQVLAPEAAEDALAVPVIVSAPALQGVKEVLVFSDLNPIPRILRYIPTSAAPTIGFRFKVEQSTPIRAAMRTDEGWHVGGVWLQASGGGCTAPSAGTGTGLWQDRLNEVSARLWPVRSGQRLKLRVIHPMDTGLAAGIPVFHLEYLELRDSQGRSLARIEPFEPVSENPVFSVDLRVQGAVHLRGRDIQGNPVAARVAP